MLEFYSMLKIEELRPGNLIGFDHDERRSARPLPLMTGFFSHIDERKRIVFDSGVVRHVHMCTGIQITRELLSRHGYTWDVRGFVFPKWVNTHLVWHNGWNIYGPDGEKKIEYFHQLQNFNEDIKVI